MHMLEVLCHLPSPIAQIGAPATRTSALRTKIPLKKKEEEEEKKKKEKEKNRTLFVETASALQVAV